jgi:hypothetical protein
MTFYVDSISDDGRIGLADSQPNIAYNNSLLGQKYVGKLTDAIIEYDEASTMGYAGRFLYCAEISLNQSISRITFIDCCKDEQLVFEIASGLMQQSEEFTQKFIEAFYKQLGVYDKIYNSVTLVVGQAPSSNA